MLRHRSTLNTFNASQLETVDEAGRWRPAIEEIAPLMALKAVSIALLRDEEMAGNVRDDLLYEDDEVNLRNLQAFSAGVAEYLRTKGQREYPTWGKS